MIKQKTVNKKLTDEYKLVKITETHVSYKHLKCGTITTKTNDNFRHCPKCSHKKCKAEAKSKTCLGKYGVKHPSQAESVKIKKKETTLKNHGVEYPGQSADVREKMKATMLKRYGVENPSQSFDIKDKTKKTNLERYGVEHPLQSSSILNKMKKTNLEKYGVSYVLQSDTVQKKIKSTMLERYGVTHALQSKNIHDKMRATCLKKYGAEHVMELPDMVLKSRKTCLKKYGVESPSQCETIKIKNKKTVFKKMASAIEERLAKAGYILLEEYKGQRNNKLSKDVWTKYKIKHVACGNVFKDDVFKTPRCPKCFKEKGISQAEKYWSEYIKTLGFDVVENDRTVIRPKEIDIYIPSMKVGFEYNGTYWHSEKFKNSTYHDNKVALAKEAGVTLIHLWESDSDDYIKEQIDYILK